ncbi:MAG: CvpA family protein [Clostridia bacterium]|nr:CvpA family protein [Clostridia bacterium]
MEFSIPSLILDGIAVLIIVISLITGIKRGFFKSLAFLFAVVAAVFVSMTFSDRLAVWLNEKFVNEGVNEKIIELIEKIVPEETEGTETQPAEGEEKSGSEETEKSEEAEKSDSFLDALTNGGATFSALFERLGSSVDELLGKIKDKTGDALKGAAEELADPLSTKISKGVAVIILFVATLLLALIVIKLFDVIFSTAPLSGINRLLGAIVGLIKGILLAFIFCFAACRLVPPLSGLIESIPTDIIEKTFIVRHVGLF